MARKVEELITGLYTLYHKRSVSRDSLKTSFEEEKHLIPSRIGGTLPQGFRPFPERHCRNYTSLGKCTLSYNVKTGSKVKCILFYFISYLYDTKIFYF